MCYGRAVQLFFLALALVTAACGGGGGTGGVQTPPPTADFSIALSSNSINIAQGNTSAPITVSITPENGFSASVQLLLSGLPAGVISNPASPFSAPPGQNVTVLFAAGTGASTGQSTVTVQATSGTLVHSVSFALAIQTAPVTNFPRTTFVEDDFVAALDSPTGQPNRRHIVYDPANQRFYVSNLAMNRVEIISEGNPSLESAIPAPGASSVDLSPDESTLWVGTDLEQILAIDTSVLQVAARYAITGVTTASGSVYIRPIEALVLSSDQLVVRLRRPAATQTLLAMWNPPTNTFTNLTSLAPSLFQNGAGIMARSGDHSCFLVAANDASGQVALFNASGALRAGPSVPLAGTISAAAANENGKMFAIAVSISNSSLVLLLDADLNLVGSYSSPGPTGLVFSGDSQTLYVAEPYGNANAVSVLSTNTMQVVGQVPDLFIQGVPTQIDEIGATEDLAGLNNRGIALLDVSEPGLLPEAAALFSGVPTIQPSEGPVAGGTTVSVAGSNFASNPQVRFGWSTPASATSSSNSQLQVSSPANAAGGPVNVAAYFANGWIAMAPSAFSYGPQILRLFPNAGTPQGGDTITVLGYGFGTGVGNITATLGGKTASVQNAQAFPAFAAQFDLDSTYPFALECITLTTPPGSAGQADLTIQSPVGSTTASKAFQYLSAVNTYSNPPLYKFITYDQSRQHLYLSATDHVDVFDLNALGFVNPIEPPPNGPPPDAGLRGMALTPDSSQLIISDFGAQSVYIVNPDGAAYNGTAVSVGGVAGFPASGPARVTTTSTQAVFVSLSGEGSSTATCTGCLGELNLLTKPPVFQSAPQPEVSSLTGPPLLQADAAGNLAYLAYNTSPGGPVALWDAATPDVFSVSSANDAATDLVAGGDGTFFALRSTNSTEIRGANLSLVSSPAAPELETIPNRVAVPGIALHPTGALTYEPFLTGPPPAARPAVGIRGGIDIRDAHSGTLRLRLYLPEAFAMLDSDVDGLHACFLTTDENGQRLFALTTHGLTIVQLARVPLGIGTLSPSSGSAAGGASVTVRGSGFQSGVTATLGGKSVVVAQKDVNTLILTTPVLSAGPQQLVLKNPDGQLVRFDAAFTAQ